MTDACLVNILDACNDLLVDADGRFLVKTLVFNDVVEKLTITAILHHEVQLSLCLNNLLIRGSFLKNRYLPHKVELR